MKKRIAGSALIAASMVLAFHPVLLKTGDSQERKDKIQQSEVRTDIKRTVPVTVRFCSSL